MAVKRTKMIENNLIDNEPVENNNSEHNINLNQEKLTVKRQRRKVGEVIVRKEVETEMIRVPLRKEKLIIEREINSEVTKLAEIDLSRSISSEDSVGYTVKGDFLSLEMTLKALKAIASEHPQIKNTPVKIELIVKDPQLQETYQEVFDRCRGF